MPLDQHVDEQDDLDINSGFESAASEAQQQAQSRLMDELLQAVERREQRAKPKELSEKEYKALADEIAKTGEIPAVLKEALKNGISNNGINIDKLNELLKDKGLKLHLEPLPTGLKLSLEKGGTVIDVEVAKTEAARESSRQMRGRPAAARPGDGVPRPEDRVPRPGDGIAPRPREVTEADIAREIAKNGKIPDYIKKAVEKGLDPNGKGLDLDKINKALEKMGSSHRIEIKPGPNGIQIELKKDGKVVDTYEATSPAARESAERIRQRQQQRPPQRPADQPPGERPPKRPSDTLPGDFLPHRVEVAAATLDIREDRQILALGDGQKLVVSENGGWYLQDKNGPINIEPQLTKEMRVPQWNALSNGGRVTFHDNATEIVSGKYKIVIDGKGVKSVEHDGKPIKMELPAEKPELRSKEVKLTTGDILQVHEDKQVLKMADGAKLVMKEDGGWYLTDNKGPVRVENQYSLEIRSPQWNALSNGGVVTFYDNRTEIKMPDGCVVNFDGKGLLSVTRGGKTETLRKPGASSKRT